MPTIRSSLTASVVIPTFNRAELLEATLQALGRSTADPESFEIIVIDDGSGDDTFERVRAFAPGRKVKYAFQPDQGFRAGRAGNLGIALAEGKVCILLDCGVFADPDLVEAHVAAHAQGDRPVAIGYVFGFENGDGTAEALPSALRPGDVRATLAAINGRPEFHDSRGAAHGRSIFAAGAATPVLRREHRAGGRVRISRIVGSDFTPWWAAISRDHGQCAA